MTVQILDVLRYGALVAWQHTAEFCTQPAAVVRLAQHEVELLWLHERPDVVVAHTAGKQSTAAAKLVSTAG